MPHLPRKAFFRDCKEGFLVMDRTQGINGHDRAGIGHTGAHAGCMHDGDDGSNGTCLCGQGCDRAPVRNVAGYRFTVDAQELQFVQRGFQPAGIQVAENHIVFPAEDHCGRQGAADSRYWAVGTARCRRHTGKQGFANELIAGSGLGARAGPSSL